MKTTHLALAALSVLATCGALASRASADPVPIFGLAGLALQPAEPNPNTTVAAAIAFASTAGASHVERVAFVPFDHLYCDSTFFRSVEIFDADAAGDVTAPLYSSDTSCTGTGDWTAGAAALSVTLSYDLPAGHTLYATWHAAPYGVALPAGAWRVE